MPEWLPAFIEKIKNKGKGVEIDEKVFMYTDESLPGVKVTEDVGEQRYLIEGDNEYGQKFEMEYEAPKTLEGGEKFPGEFTASDSVPVHADPDGNVDFDGQIVDSVDEILGGDAGRIETYTTGESRYTQGQKIVDQSEAKIDAMKDEIDIDEGFKDGGLTNTIPPKRGPMSEGVESLFRTR